MSVRHLLASMAFMSALVPAGMVVAQDNVPEPPSECTTASGDCVRDPEVPAQSNGPDSSTSTDETDDSSGSSGAGTSGTTDSGGSGSMDSGGSGTSGSSTSNN